MGDHFYPSWRPSNYSRIFTTDPREWLPADFELFHTPITIVYNDMATLHDLLTIGKSDDSEEESNDSDDGMYVPVTEEFIPLPPFEVGRSPGTKHSRHFTGFPCIGLNGTVQRAPQSPQVAG